MHVYGDESGKFHSSEKLAFASWVSDMEGWIAFDENWRSLMKDSGIQFIHTSELMGHHKNYQGREFSTDEKVQLLRDCLKLANRTSPLLVASAVDCQQFRSLTTSTQHKLGDDGHIMCFIAFLHQLTILMEEGRLLSGVGIRKPIALMFDDNPEYAAECYTILSTQRQNNPLWNDWIKSICFADDEFNSPIQAADILAWISRHHLSNKFPSRPPLVPKETIDELMSVVLSGITKLAIEYSGENLRIIDEEMGKGSSFFDIVRLNLKPVGWVGQQT
jgi:hypothetical protein